MAHNDNIMQESTSSDASVNHSDHSPVLEVPLFLKAGVFDALMKYLPDNIALKDHNSCYITVNDAWCRYSGIADPARVFQKSDHDLFSTPLADKLARKDRQVIKSKEPHVGVIEKTDDLHEQSRRISMTRLPVTDPDTGEVIAVLCMSKDLTTRTNVERELAHERDILHTLLDHSKDAIYFKNIESKYLRISRAHPAMQFFDTPEQAIGKSDFDFFSAEHAQHAYADEQRIIATGEPILGIIEHESGPGLPERWVLTSKMPMYDKNGTIIGTFGLSRDITDIKQYEQELSAAKSDLEDRVLQRTKDLQTANLDLERRIAQLDFLTSASYEMARLTDLNDIAHFILYRFSLLLKNAAGMFSIRDDQRFKCIAVAGVTSDLAVNSIIEESIVFHLLDTIRQPALLDDWQFQFSPSMLPETLKGFPRLLVIPLIADNRTIGLLHIFSDDILSSRLRDEEQVILTLATHSAVSVSNALYYKELGEKAQLQAELDAARSIQQRLTPRFSPDIPGISLKGLYSPAYEVGGDYLDYFKNDAGCWVVIVADICGKGIPAALLMTILRSSFRVEARNETSARNLLCSVNSSMQANLDDRSFVTALCLVIAPDGSHMSYARAGHPRLIQIKGNNGGIGQIASDGIALGILPDFESFHATIDEIDINLTPGDQYFIYTDGLTEAFDHEKNTYGNERLFTMLQKYKGNQPEALIDTVIRDIKKFTKGAPYHDDLTLIALSVNKN